MISFAITVCDEHEQFRILLENIQQCVLSGDEVVVQCDKDNVTEEVKAIIDTYKGIVDFNFIVTEYSLNKDFASFKNHLKSKCSNKWVFQIDADEFLSDSLLDSLHTMLEENENLDLIYVPRINIVDGITQRHLDSWMWKVSKHDDYVSVKNFTEDSAELELLKKHNLIRNKPIKVPYSSPEKYTVEYYKPIINFPDYQSRILKNKPEIRWEGFVHEQIVGFETYSSLPAVASWSLVHIKDIEKQESQNEFYQTI